MNVLDLREEGKSHDLDHFRLGMVRSDDGPRSTLRCTQANPPKLTLTYVLDLVLTARSSDGAEEGRVHTKIPAVQSVELRQWPPKGEVFTLEGPIRFVFPEDPNEIAATIDKYPTQERGDLFD